MKQNSHSSSSNTSDERIKSVRHEYQQKLSHMEEEVKKLKFAQKEHAKLMRERSVHERQLKVLKEEMTHMKKNKVKVMKFISSSTFITHVYSHKLLLSN